MKHANPILTFAQAWIRPPRKSFYSRFLSSAADNEHIRAQRQFVQKLRTSAVLDAIEGDFKRDMLPLPFDKMVIATQLPESTEQVVRVLRKLGSRERGGGEYSANGCYYVVHDSDVRAGQDTRSQLGAISQFQEEYVVHVLIGPAELLSRGHNPQGANRLYMVNPS
jgi:hypothetical protein